MANYPTYDPRYVAPQPASSPSTPSASGGMPSVNAGGGDIGQQISSYFKSRGVSDQETPYWTQKWGEFGAKDPAYFNQRLSQADIFGKGGGQQPSGGGQPPFNMGAIQALLQQLLQGGAMKPQSPFSGGLSATSGTSGAVQPPTAGNPYSAWLGNEQKNTMGQPQLSTQPLPTVNQPQQADVNTMIQQALMRAFLGGR